MLEEEKLRRIKLIFLMAAFWYLAGTYLGYLNTAYAYQLFFDRELIDPLIHTIYKGAWGTTLVYFFGYLIVAYNPTKHSGIVIVGGIGKLGYVANLIQLYMSGIANSVVFIVIVGDLVFLALFAYYFVQLYKSGESLI